MFYNQAITFEGHNIDIQYLTEGHTVERKDTIAISVHHVSTEHLINIG